MLMFALLACGGFDYMTCCVLCARPLSPVSLVPLRIRPLAVPASSYVSLTRYTRPFFCCMNVFVGCLNQWSYASSGAMLLQSYCELSCHVVWSPSTFVTPPYDVSSNSMVLRRTGPCYNRDQFCFEKNLEELEQEEKKQEEEEEHEEEEDKEEE